MRIAFVHPSYPSSEGTGATHSATQVINGLANRGHDVCVFCARSPEKVKTSDSYQLRTLSGNSRHPHTDTRLNREIRRRADEFCEFDIVHSYLPTMIPSIAEVSRSSDVTTVVTLNAYGGICAKNDLLYNDKEQCEWKSTAKCVSCIAHSGYTGTENGYLYQTTSQLLSLRLIKAGEPDFGHIDAFRAPSKHVKENYVQFGYEPDDIFVIPHPVNEDFLIPHQSEFTEPYNLLYVGSLDRHKGVQKLVPILDELNKNETQFRLTVVGTGGLESKIRKDARNRGISHLLELTGFIPNNELPKVYASHDCFLYPGIWEEPLGRVYLEALSTGTPLVSSDYGSVAEIMGKGGVTTDGSITGFRDKILEIVKSERLPELSRAAKSHVEHYDRKQIVSQIEGMYEAKL